MRNVLGAVVAVLVACAPRSTFIAPPGPPQGSALSTRAGAPTLEIGGWVSYWDYAAGMQDVRSSAASLSDVFLFTVHLDRAGAPVSASADLDLSAAVREVRQTGARPWLTIVNDVVDASGRVQLKDAQAVHAMLVDPDLRARHRAAILALAVRHGAAGVDLDYERLPARDRDPFTTLVAELRQDLRRAGISLSVTVQPKLAETGGDGPGAEDWAALCEQVDRLQIMLYNEHSGRTLPGPVASPAWIERVLGFALTQCAPERIVAAIKVVGTEWSPDGTRDVPFAKALLQSHVEGVSSSRRDDEVPWLRQGDGDERRTIYYEDARSLVTKLRAVQRLGIQRVVLWTLGSEDPAFWDSAASLIRRREVPRPRAASHVAPGAPIRTASRP